MQHQQELILLTSKCTIGTHIIFFWMSSPTPCLLDVFLAILCKVCDQSVVAEDDAGHFRQEVATSWFGDVVLVFNEARNTMTSPLLQVVTFCNLNGQERLNVGAIDETEISTLL